MTKRSLELSRRAALRRGAIATGALVIGGTATSGTAAAGIGDGRVGHYHLNNIKPDGTVLDASPEENHGTNDGASVVKGDGKVGNAFEFDGEDDYVKIGHDESLNVADVTVTTWLRFDGSADYHFFLSKRGTEDEYQMYCRGVDAGSSSTELAYYDGATVYDATVALSQSTWHHLAWVISDEGGFSGYIDGRETVIKPDAGTPNSSTTEDLFIGKDNVGNYAKGKADEVRVYDRALSNSEIQSLASMGGNSGGNGQGNGNAP